MIRGRYGLLTALVVAAMLSVAAGAGLLMVYAPLPDPSVATREQLFHWLIFRDLSQESEEIRQKILSRLDTEFEKVSDIGPGIENLEDSHRRMLWHNVTVLVEPWLLGKVEEYSKLPDSLKNDYIRSLPSITRKCGAGSGRPACGAVPARGPKTAVP